MNTILNVSAKIDRPYLLKALVEDLASRRTDTGFSYEACPQQWRPLEPSSVEAFVDGVFIFSNRGEKINVPFTAPFLFTCTKEKGWGYRLAWAVSLS